MKKAIAVILVLLLAVSAAACQKGETDAPQATKAAATEAPGSAGTPKATEAPEPAAEPGTTAEPDHTAAPASGGGASVLSYSVSLEKVKAIPAEDLDRWSCTFYEGGIVRFDGDGCTVLDPLGEDRLGKTFDACKGLTDGVFVTYLYDQFPNYCGLVSTDGEMLVPCETVGFWTIGDGSRYVEAIYATEKLESRDGAYVYISEPNQTVYPDESNMYFAGYSRIYDLKERRFIDGIEPGSMGSKSIVGDNLYLRDSDELYRPDGSLVAKGELYLSGDCIIGEENPDGTYTIFNSELEELFSVPFRPSEYFPELGLFCVDGYDLGDEYDSMKYYLIDQAGEAASPIAFSHSLYTSGGFVYGRGEEYYLVVDAQGNTVVDEEDGFTNIEGIGNTGFLEMNKNGEYWLLFPDGSRVPCDSLRGINAFRDTGDQEAVLILKDRDYTFKADHAESLMLRGELPLVAVRNSEGQWAVLDADSGRLLTGYDYISLDYSNGYVYARTEDGWDVYRIVVG